MKTQKSKPSIARIHVALRQGHLEDDTSLIDLTKRAKAVDFPFAVVVSEDVYKSLIDEPAVGDVPTEKVDSQKEQRLLELLTILWDKFEITGSTLRPLLWYDRFLLDLDSSGSDCVGRFILEAYAFECQDAQVQITVHLGEDG